MKKRIFISMFTHLIIVWILLTLYNLLPYIYEVHLHGNYLYKADGTATTAWEYFTLFYYKPNIYRFLSVVLIFIPLVELNYWFVIKKYRLGSVIITSSIIGIVATIAILFPWYPITFSTHPFAFLDSFLVFTAYTLIYGLIRKYFYERINMKELLLQRSENELNTLKAQLNPHFFFNSLNYLYGTALKEHAEYTAESISIMSDMMRYTISANQKNYVPLAEELKFIENFLFLQRVRIPEKESIRIETSIISDNGEHVIAPLLLLPFIENAFKYGISIEYPSFIKISIAVNKHQLIMEVNNRVINEHTEVKGNNTGISNTRKRLELLYKGKYLLQCDETESEYKIFLSIILD